VHQWGEPERALGLL